MLRRRLMIGLMVTALISFKGERFCAWIDSFGEWLFALGKLYECKGEV
jgi:hypothetical protein